MNIDLEHLTLTQIVITLFAITFLDWASGVAGAIKRGEFTLQRVADFLITHVIGRVVPLSFMAALGLGIPQLDLPPIFVLWSLFLIGGVAYVAETVASIATNLNIPIPHVADTTSAPTDDDV